MDLSSGVRCRWDREVSRETRVDEITPVSSAAVGRGVRIRWWGVGLEGWGAPRGRLTAEEEAGDSRAEGEEVEEEGWRRGR